MSDNPKLVPSEREGSETCPERTQGIPNPQSAEVAARAEAWGVDLSLLRESLALTPTERLERHDKSLAFILEFADEVKRARAKKQPQGFAVPSS